MSRRQTRSPQTVEGKGSDGTQQRIVIEPHKMHPMLKLIIIVCIGFLTFMNFLWLSGWYTPTDDVFNGAMRGIALLCGPLSILLLGIADRQ